MRTRALFVMVGLSGLALALLPSAGAAAPGSCPTLDVSASQAAGALASGTYAVGSLAGADDPCAAAQTVVQSYLYDPPSFGTWRVDRLAGGRGLRFSSGATTFEVTATSRVVRPSAGRAAAARAPVATAAATQRCFPFRVVHDDSEVGFPAGVYQRLNFAPSPSRLRCSPPMPDSFDLLRDYLLDGDVRGWRVGRLQGSLARYPGCRFLQNGQGGRVGFDVWCDGRGGSRGPCVRARPVGGNCGSHY